MSYVVLRIAEGRKTEDRRQKTDEGRRRRDAVLSLETGQGFAAVWKKQRAESIVLTALLFEIGFEMNSYFPVSQLSVKKARPKTISGTRMSVVSRFMGKRIYKTA